MQAEQSTADRCAAKSPYNTERQAAFKRHFASQAVQVAEFYEAKDADDLDRRLCNGDFERVVFDSLEDLLETVWNEEADLSQWHASGVKIELLAGGEIDAAKLRFLLDTHACHCKWLAGRKRRRLIVATILSVIALIAMAILFSFAPFTR